MTLQFANPGHLLPTLPGKVSGVVFHEPPIVVVQCAICFNTATGKTIFAVNEMNFAPDGEGSPRGPTSYRRCSECREERKHPSAE